MTYYDCARKAKSRNGKGDNSGRQTLGFDLPSSLEFLLKAEGIRGVARMRPVLNWWKSGGRDKKHDAVFSHLMGNFLIYLCVF